MIALIKNIFQAELGQKLMDITPIVGLGTVNKVYEVSGTKESFIIRLNHDQEKKIEYHKEQWCLEAVHKLGIPSPQVIAIGEKEGFVYLIQNKVKGINGSLCSPADKLKIWERLGAYALKFSQIKSIDLPAVNEAEFHANWKHRLIYNLEQLAEEDSLLKERVFNIQDHQLLKSILSTLVEKKFPTGLIHGDLCPRNIIFQSSQVCLIDWGTAGINIIPHTEIGKILTQGQANPAEIQSFLKGLQLTREQYLVIEEEVWKIHLLNELDTYRWASTYAQERIADYQDKVKVAFAKVVNHQ